MPPVAEHARRGVALLETIVALAILATAGLAWLGMASQTSASLERALEREARTRLAAALLGRYASLSALELEAAAGRRQDRGLEVRVSLLGAGLVEVRVVDPPTGVELLRTVLFRPTDGTTNAR